MNNLCFYLKSYELKVWNYIPIKHPFFKKLPIVFVLNFSCIYLSLASPQDTTDMTRPYNLMEKKEVSITKHTPITVDLFAAKTVSNNTLSCIQLKINAWVCGSITCSNPKVTLYVSTNYSCVSYLWTGPNGFVSQQKNPVVSIAGTYTVKVTMNYGQWAKACVTVTQNIKAPGASACVNGSLSCSKTSVTLLGSSPTKGVKYKWTGPNNFVSTQQNPVVTVAGIYTLVVTNPANGCSSTSKVTVLQNGSNIDVTVSGGVLTCKTLAVKLNATSSVSGVTYSWTGPSGFTSNLQQPSVTLPGTYIVTVATPDKGCTKKDSVTVTQDVIKPNLSIAPVNTLTCTTTSVSLNASSTTSGATFTWTGFTAGQNPVNVSAPGNYIVTAINNTNGCVKKDSVTVSQSVQHPDIVTSVSDTLTCNTTSVTLLGNSGTSGVTYSWSGPLTFASTEQNPVTNHPGIYTLIVTDPANGCSSSSNVTVMQDTSAATGLHTNVSGTLTCTVSSVTITGSSTTSGVTYNWTGPNGFSSSNQNVVVSSPGNYILHVGKQSNGCVVSSIVEVLQDTVKPKGVVAEASGILSCQTSSVVLTGSSTTSGVSYNWTGPGFVSTGAVVNVATPGTYTLTVTDTANGCTTVKSVSVDKDTTPPENVTASVSGAINCVNSFVTLTGSSTTPGTQYLWTSPDNTEDPNDITYAFTPGVYTLKVTNPGNGCSVIATVTVTIDTVQPASKILPLTASPVALTNDTLTAQAVSNATYSWELSSANQNWSVISGTNDQVLYYHSGDAGTNATFTLKVTSNQNGCSGTSQIVLIAVSALSYSPMIATDVEKDEKNLPIKVYPNPFSDRAMIEFTPEQSGHTTVELYTNNGILVSVPFNAEVQVSQSYKVVVDGSTMAAGTYYCVLRTNNKRNTFKLILTR